MWRLILGYLALPVLMAGVFFAAPALAKTYELGPGHTNISLSWDHYGFPSPVPPWA